MFPFITVFGRQIPTYGLLIATGGIFAILLALARGKKTEIKREDIFYSAIYCVIGAILGAKLLYIFTVIPQIIQVWNQTDNHFALLYQMIGSGGFVFYGGFLGAIGALYLYTRQYKVDFIELCDLFAPSVALGHCFGRIGCFMVGCCYGVESEFGIAFHNSIGAPNGVSLFPVQLVEAGLNLILCGVLLLYHPHRKHKGNTALLYIACYAVVRFVLEFFRGDGIRGILFGISLSQYIAMGAFVAVVVLWMVRAKRAKQKASAETQ